MKNCQDDISLILSMYLILRVKLYQLKILSISNLFYVKGWNTKDETIFCKDDFILIKYDTKFYLCLKCSIKNKFKVGVNHVYKEIWQYIYMDMVQSSLKSHPLWATLFQTRLNKAIKNILFEFFFHGLPMWLYTFNCSWISLGNWRLLADR